MKPFTRLILVLALLLTASASALAREITGTVTDSSDEPLIGVSVTAGDSKVGVSTDIDGNFSISVPNGPVTLKFAYVGYNEHKQLVPADVNKINVVLQESSTMLEETVVIGYGSQKKVNLTGAVASIDGAKFEDRTSGSVSNMLQGAVAGLNVTTSSGVPGESASFNVRGQTSINGGSPLVLIDGSIGDINMVNPNDVDNISVIKDASAAAVYGARAAYGVILVTTKSGQAKEGMATVRFNARAGWETATTSTDFETRGYWSTFICNQFWYARAGENYVNYGHEDMMELLARVNDKTENPDRPWVVEENRNGKNQWYYYANTDWYGENIRRSHPSQQYNISFSGGKDKIKYFLSGGADLKEGMLKLDPDKYKKFNLRSKLDFAVNKWVTVQNNTSFYSSEYSYQGAGGDVQDTFAYLNRHALALFPLKNPDGTWLGNNPYIGYRVGNFRHAIVGGGTHPNKERKTDFMNTFRLNIQPIEQLIVTGDFTYRFNQTRDTHRWNKFAYRQYPDADLEYYITGAGENKLQEDTRTRNYYSANAFATYKDSFNDAHNLTVVAGFNYEKYDYKRINVMAYNISSETLNDIGLIVPITASDGTSANKIDIAGGQNEYALAGFFGRANYDYKGKYLAEISARYDGTSRFGKGHRWGFFPSASIGWRISEENFWKDLRSVWNNAKIRLSYGELGNQQTSSYYNFVRTVTSHTFNNFNFGTGTGAQKYTSLSAPISSDLTWETSKQWDLGLDFSFLNNRLTFTGDVYVRDTDNMLTDGLQLPGVYGADVPQMNIANLRTKGYEIAFQWNDSFELFSHRFNYNIGFQLSDYRSHITKFESNGNKLLTTYYEGQRLGDLWGYCLEDRYFATTEEAQEYASKIDLSTIRGGLPSWEAGDVIFKDLNGDGKVNQGRDDMIKWNDTFYIPGDAGYEEAASHLTDENPATKSEKVPVNSLYNHGDRVNLGNTLPSLMYGITAGFQYVGIDFSIFFQGTGNHVWYPSGQNFSFWGPFAYEYVTFLPSDFYDKVWQEDNVNSYFPRPMGRGAWSKGPLQYANDKYLQNIRYCRLKNVTVGYTLPKKWTRKACIEKVRVYFSGENLHYWSPLKKNTKYVDPESAFNRSSTEFDNYAYPWPRTFMFGLDLTI